MMIFEYDRCNSLPYISIYRSFSPFSTLNLGRFPGILTQVFVLCCLCRDGKELNMNDKTNERSLREQFVQMVTDQVGKGIYV